MSTANCNNGSQKAAFPYGEAAFLLEGRNIKDKYGITVKKSKKPLHIRTAATVLTALCLVSVPAYAGGVEATVNSFVSKLLSKFSAILLGICDMLVSPVFSITTMRVEQIAAYIPGFNTAAGTGDFFVRGVQLMGSCVAACLAMLSVLKIIVGLARDEKVSSVSALIGRMAFFIPMTICGQSLLRALFDQVITPVSSAFAAGVLSFSNDAVFATVAAPLTGDTNKLAALVVGTILMVMIGYSLISLVLEAAERYIICIVIIFLSPLAFAAGVGEETAQVAKNWLRMFWSQSVLLILNIWVVGIGRTCFDALDPSATETQIIVWGLITYAYFKIAQKLDDIMQNSGLMVTRTGSDIVRDATLAVGSVAAAGKSLFGGAVDTVIAGAGVAKEVKAGAGVGEIARPIANYVRSHPILAPTAGVAAAAVGGTVGFASQMAASHAIAHTPDKMRAADMDVRKNDVNTPAFRTAAYNQLLQAGVSGVKNGRVENLVVHSDGTLGGVLTQRDSAGYVQSQTDFTLSNVTGTPDGINISTGRQMTVGADGKSAALTDPQSGNFTFMQTGTDRYGNQVWEAVRTTDGKGWKLDTQKIGSAATEAFTFRPDARNVDGPAAQAVSAFMSSGTMDSLIQNSDRAIAGYNQRETDKAAALHDLNTMSDAERAAQMRDENSAVDYGGEGYRAATAEYMCRNGLDDGMIERGGAVIAQQIAEDGRLFGCLAVKDAEGSIQEEKFYALSTQAAEADIFAPAAAPAHDAEPLGVAPTGEIDMDDTAEEEIPVEIHGENAEELSAPASGAEVVPVPRQESCGTSPMPDSVIAEQENGESDDVPYWTGPSATGYSAQEADAEKIAGSELSPVLQPEMDASVESTMTQPAPASAPTSDIAFSEPVSRTQAGAEEIRTVTPALDNILTAKYQMFDESHGMVETSELGRLQVSRVSVDETTGNSKWQIIRKGGEGDSSDPNGDGRIVTFERRGNRGAAQTFQNVIRDIRNTRTFDQLALLDSKNTDRPDDSHLFQ